MEREKKDRVVRMEVGCSDVAQSHMVSRENPIQRCNCLSSDNGNLWKFTL